MGELSGKTILVGVTGGIAAYKTPNLVSMLVQQGADVHVLLTENAKNIIPPVPSSFPPFLFLTMYSQ